MLGLRLSGQRGSESLATSVTFNPFAHPEVNDLGKTGRKGASSIVRRFGDSQNSNARFLFTYEHSSFAEALARLL
jgi:hypothetical protein